MADELSKICPNCGGQMIPDIQKGVFRCPNCDKEIMFEESDDVKKERIRTASNAEVENKRIQANVKIEQEKQKTERELARNKNVPIILFALAAVGLLIIFVGQKLFGTVSNTIDDWNHSGEVKITSDLVNLKDLDYLTVRSKLATAGFTEIELVGLEDLGPKLESKAGVTESVSINDNKAYKVGEWYQPDAAVAVRYHSVTEKGLDGIQALQNYDYYEDLDYNVALSDFSDAGFRNIELIPLKDVNPKSDKLGLVKKITVNGVSTYKYLDLFPETANVSIQYHSVELQKFSVGTAAEDFKKKDYKSVIETIKSAGFYNFEYVLQEAGLFTKKNSVDSVSIGGKYNFDEYDKFLENEVVVVTINVAKKDMKAMDAELNAKEGESAVPLSSKNMVGKIYETVVQQLEDAGFTNITTVPNPDLKKGFGLFKKKDGEIQSVTINGDTEFAKSDIFKSDDLIRIVYHTYPSEEVTVINDTAQGAMSFGGTDVKLRNYQEVIDELKSLGFTNIKTETIADIDDESKLEEGAVEKVLVDGKDDFKMDSIYDKDVEIIVTYHTKKE